MFFIRVHAIELHRYGSGVMVTGPVLAVHGQHKQMVERLTEGEGNLLNI